MTSNTIAQTKQPVNLASQIPASGTGELSGIYFLILLVWAVCGLVVAQSLGTFRPKSIHGPERLKPDESAWWLLVILCGSFLISGRMTAIAKPHLAFNLPAEVNTLLNGGLTELLIFVFVIIISMIVRRDALRLIGLRIQQLPLGVIGGIITMFVLFPLIMMTELFVTKCFLWLHRQPPKPHEVLQLIGETRDRRVMLIGILMATMVAPLFEELFFRGMMQTMLGRLINCAFRTERITNAESSQPSSAVTISTANQPILGAPAIGYRARWLAVIITAAAFAASHIEPAFLAPIFVLALGLGYVYERTGNLWMTIAAHSAFNSLQILLFLHG